MLPACRPPLILLLRVERNVPRQARPLPVETMAGNMGSTNAYYRNGANVMRRTDTKGSEAAGRERPLEIVKASFARVMEARAGSGRWRFAG